MYRINQSLLNQISARVAARFRGAAGDGTKVGLFIRVPEHLAVQFPPAPIEDASPRHVTLLYVGKVEKADQPLFLQVVRGVLEGWGSIDAAFDGLDYFVHPEENRRVYYARVKFDRDMGSLRDRLTHMLGEFGFEVENSFPLAYIPHATLSYVDGLDTEYVGPVPDGEWTVSEIDVWGLPQEHSIELGDSDLINTKLAEIDLDWKFLWENGKQAETKKDIPDKVSAIVPTAIAIDLGMKAELKLAHGDFDIAWDIVQENLAFDPHFYDE